MSKLDLIMSYKSVSLIRIRPLPYDARTFPQCRFMIKVLVPSSLSLLNMI